MATQIDVFIRFSDGTFASLVNNNVTSNTLTEIQTGGTDLAQVSGVSVGQAFTGKVATHAMAKVTTEDASTGAFCYAYFLDPSGKISGLVQGGGDHCSEFPALLKPVRMQTGVTLQARWMATADGATQQASLAVYCASGVCDVFTVAAVDATKTAMVNPQGATIGQALDGQVIAKCYATYSSSFGINESQQGNGAFYIESSEGQLKAMYPPGKHGGSESTIVPWQSYPVRISQNDTLSVMSDNS
jgi:hypothetical protein